METYGERMKQFINKSAAGKKIKEDLKLMSDSWLIGNIYFNSNLFEESFDFTFTSLLQITI